jgi:hypothetical protein
MKPAAQKKAGEESEKESAVMPASHRTFPLGIKDCVSIREKVLLPQEAIGAYGAHKVSKVNVSILISSLGELKEVIAVCAWCGGSGRW